MNNVPGIYLIKNIITGQSYVGRTIRTIKSRFREHKKRLAAGSHDNVHLQRSWNKYGESAFVFEILSDLTGKLDIAGYEENLYIEKHKSLSEGFNMMAVDINGDPCHTEETKAKIAAAHKGKVRPAFSQEWLDNLGAAHKGKKASEATKLRMSKALRGLKKPPMTATHKEKIALANLGKTVSAEVRKKISDSHKGKHHTEATKQKLSDQRSGKPGRKHSEEEKQKIRRAHLANAGRSAEKIQEIRERAQTPEYKGRGGFSKLSRFLGIPRTTLARLLKIKR